MIVRLALAVCFIVPALAQGPIIVTSPDGQPVKVDAPATVSVPCRLPADSIFPIGITDVPCPGTSYTVTVNTRQRFDWERDTEYLGSFLVPKGVFNGTTFEYNGQGLAYDEARDGLFLTSRDSDAAQPPNGLAAQRVAEISIAPIGGTATFLQPFTEPTEGKYVTAAVPGSPFKIGDYLVRGGQLCGTNFAYYDGNSAQTLSHWCRPSDLSVKGQVQGFIGLITPTAPLIRKPVRFTHTILADIPEEWQTALGGDVLTGGCCVAIVSGTSNGPAAFGWNAAQFAQGQAVTPLIYTPYGLAPNYLAQSDLWNATTQMSGMFISGPSLVYVYRQGIGPGCYGIGGETPPATLPAGTTWCYDPADGSKGVHAYPYVYRSRAFDIADLLASGGKPWTVPSYASWTFELPNARPNHALNGLAFDRAGGRLFISQFRGDENRPRIHVFRVKN